MWNKNINMISNWASIWTLHGEYSYEKYFNILWLICDSLCRLLLTHMYCVKIIQDNFYIFSDEMHS